MSDNNVDMKVSCGGILYAYNNAGDVGVILGREGGGYFPLKGRKEPGETMEQTAMREIYEESCGTVKLNDIVLDCKIESTSKKYFLGLVEVNYNIIEEFINKRKNETRPSFIELTELKFYKLSELFATKLPLVTYKAVCFYRSKLSKLQHKKYNWRNAIVAKNVNSITQDSVMNNIYQQTVAKYTALVAPIKIKARLRLSKLMYITM